MEYSKQLEKVNIFFNSQIYNPWTRDHHHVIYQSIYDCGHVYIQLQNEVMYIHLMDIDKCIREYLYLILHVILSNAQQWEFNSIVLSCNKNTLDENHVHTTNCWLTTCCHKMGFEFKCVDCQYITCTFKKDLINAS